MIEIVSRLRAYFAGRTFVTGVAALAGGAGLGQGLAVLAAPILTRLYTPDDLGILAAYAALVNILVVLSALRYEQAIPLAENDDQAAHILALALGITVVTTAIIGLAAAALKDSFAAWARIPAAGDYVWLLPVGVFATGVYQTLSYWALRQGAFTVIGRTKFRQGAGMVISQMGLGLLQAGPTGLLLGHIVGQSSGIATLTHLLESPRRLAAGLRWDTLRRMAVRYRRFPLFSSWSGVLNSIGFNLPTLLLAALYGADVAGLFMLAQRVIGTPLRLISVSVGQVFYSRAAQLNHQDPQALAPFFLKTATSLLLIGVGPIILFMAAGPPLFGLIFGPAWQDAGQIMRVLAPMLLAEFVVSPVSQIVFVLQRQDLQLVWDASIPIMVLAVFGLASARTLEPIATIGLYSAGAVLAQVAAFALYWALLRRNRSGASD